MSESKQLTVPERAAVALGAAEHEKTLLALATKYADITKIVNSAGREQCHAAYMELKNTRVNIEKAGKDAREDANAFQKAVIEEVKRLTAITAAEEARLQVVRDTYDAEREAERQAKAAAEKTRVDAIRKRIAEMQAIPAMLVSKSSETIAAAIESLEAVEITLESFMEFSGEAELAKLAAVHKLWEMFKAQQEHETEQKRLQAEREAIERQRAELAEQERQAAAARAAQEKADREARQAEESRLRAIREAEEAAQREAQAKAAAAMRAEQEAHAKRMAEERAKLEQEQAALAAERRRHMEEAEAARLEQERVARQAREAAEAEARAKREAEEATARAEAERIEAERRAAEQEQIRREREQFAMKGPGDVEIVKTLANYYGVTVGDAMQWMKKFDYDAADEQFAAMNATGDLPQLEKAA